jgi:DNA-3-methyladenine glycosylase I
MTQKTDPVRCGWVLLNDDLYTRYHDTEWGVPVRGENALFEAVILQGAQAGLSWRTVLHKREHYRKVYDGFDPALVARYDEAKLADLLAYPGIVRNKLKVRASVKNARAFLDIQQQFGGFSPWLWGFVDGEPFQRNARTLADIPASSPTSDAIAKELKAQGMTFVGSTIIYALMQACGLVNDHTIDCFRHPHLAGR